MKYLIISLLVFIILGCEETGVSSSLIAKSEIWKLVDNASVGNYANLTLSLHEDNSITCSGEWKYYFYGDTVTCSIMQGSLSTTDSITIITSGTASYPPDSEGNVESSGFNMEMKGSKNSLNSGTWNISFSKDDWKDYGQNGTYTGTLISGNGVITDIE